MPVIKRDPADTVAPGQKLFDPLFQVGALPKYQDRIDDHSYLRRLPRHATGQSEVTIDDIDELGQHVVRNMDLGHSQARKLTIGIILGQDLAHAGQSGKIAQGKIEGHGVLRFRRFSCGWPRASVL